MSQHSFIACVSCVYALFACGGSQSAPSSPSTAAAAPASSPTTQPPSPPVVANVTAGTDRDGDGIPDVNDRCPNDPEDRDGFQDSDGCPDPDNDGDGIRDVDDLCPMAAEDLDGFEDTDGCPDPDNDKDRIPDIHDKCPNDPETYNGCEDHDGCPEKLPLVILHTELKILEKIYFSPNSAAIGKLAHPTLDTLAAVLQKRNEVHLVEVQGHATTGERGPKRLAQRRALAVTRYLYKRGVPKSKLQLKSYGATRPLARGNSAAARAKNRRVSFDVLRQTMPKPPVARCPSPSP